MGSDSSSPVLKTYEATMPNHHHPHTHTTQKHSHKYDKPGTKQSNNYMNNENQWLMRNWASVSTSSVDVIVNQQKLTNLDYNSIEKYKYEKASVGDLYSRHIRVEYIFKCF